MPPAQMWAEASRILPPWVSLLLVVLIAWQLAVIVWRLVPSGEPAAPPPPSAAPRADGGSDDASVDVNRIITAHLFGEPSAEAPVTEELVDAPETQLSLELRGTIAATDPEKALAIIAERGGDEKVYAVDDGVPGGATLHSIYTDRVILRRAGRLETLRLPRSDESAGIARTGRSVSRASFTRSAPAQSIRDVVQQNSLALTDVIRPQPVFKDGQQQGYRVYPGRQRQQFAQLGLRPGDLVTQINGMALNDPARGMEIFRSLADATSVSVTVERNGQMEVLTLDTSTLQQVTPSGDESE